MTSQDNHLVAPVAKPGILQRAYDWVVSYANHPNAVWVLAAISFIESSISPIPPLPLLIPMCLANPKKAWHYAMVCAMSSVAGGFFGYAIGYGLYETLGLWIISLYGLGDKAAELQKSTHDAWFWILITIISDLFRDHEASGWTKAFWIIFLILLPFIGALLYLIIRGKGMREAAAKVRSRAFWLKSMKMR
jgi:membrane protein YqaA with SNARE-associated domain